MVDIPSDIGNKRTTLACKLNLANLNGYRSQQTYDFVLLQK